MLSDCIGSPLSGQSLRGFIKKLPTVLPGDISISTDVTDGFTVIAVFFGIESLLLHPDVN